MIETFLHFNIIYIYVMNIHIVNRNDNAYNENNILLYKYYSNRIWY